MAIPVIFVLAGLPILITWRMGKKKGRHGIWWGLILGWIGVFLLALNFPPKRGRSRPKPRSGNRSPATHLPMQHLTLRAAALERQPQ